MANKPDLKIAQVAKLEIPKKESEVNQLARLRLHELIDSLDDREIFGMAMIVMTEHETIDFYVRSAEHNAYAFIGAVECMKRDMMRSMVQSRHDYVEYDDFK